MFHKAEYQHSVTWLKYVGVHMFCVGGLIFFFFFARESYEIGRDSPSVDVVKQARTLRLLANTLLEWDGSANWQKALSAVGMFVQVLGIMTANLEH